MLCHTERLPNLEEQYFIMVVMVILRYGGYAFLRYGFMLEKISTAVSVASKNGSRLKSGQK